MGVVYEAEHRDTGDRVALKTLYCSQEKLLQSLRREIFTLSRIRHPGIISIIDHGVENGLPWYAMELLSGTTLDRHIEEIRVKTNETIVFDSTINDEMSWVEAINASPEGHNDTSKRSIPSLTPPDTVSLTNILTIMHRLCQTLSYLHGEGIVHRDLKPANIVIDDHGEPIIIDFGLLIHFMATTNREILQNDFTRVGTLGYIAPEQLAGELVDARADLYSVGCILYRLVVGRPPFSGNTMKDVIKGHLFTAPRPPSHCVPGVPADLDELILKLLAKNPRNRIGYADAVANALIRLGAWAEPPRLTTMYHPYLYRPKFTGRNAQCALIESRIEDLSSGKGGLILIGGESGIGKTRLALECGRLASRANMLVLTGECSESSQRPLDALQKPVEIIADRCRERGPEETIRLIGERGAVVRRYFPVLNDLPELSSLPDLPNLAPEAARLRLYGSLVRILSDLSETVPVFLILDDVHWADELTAGFLDFISRTTPFSSKKILILACYRSEEITDDVQRLIENENNLTLPITKLDETAITSIIADMLALEPTLHKFSRYLNQHAEGNPFFIAEFLQSAVEEGLLWRDEEGAWQIAESSARRAEDKDFLSLPLPHSLREIIDRRILSLPERALRLSEIAAINVGEIEFPLLKLVQSDPDGLVWEGMEILLKRQIIEEINPGTFRFVHNKIREVIHERLDHERFKSLNGSIADGIEHLAGENANDAILGYHRENSGALSKARIHYLAGARKACESFIHGQAERLYKAYLRLAEIPRRECIQAWNELGRDVYRVQGKSAEAIAAHRQAVQLAEQLLDREMIMISLRNLGFQLWSTGNNEEANACFEKSLNLARELPDRKVESLCLRNMAVMFLRQGMADKAHTLFMQALETIRDIADRKEEGITLSNLAVLYIEQGRPDEGRDLIEQALSIARELNHRTDEGRCLNNLAIIHHDQGRIEEAQRLMEQALVIARETGDRKIEGYVIGNLAHIALELKQFDRARDHFQQSLIMKREIGDRLSEGQTMVSMASFVSEQGQIQEALSLFEKSMIITREVGDRRFEAHCHGDRGRLLRQTGTIDEALADSSTAEAIFRELGDEYSLAKTLAERGHLLICSNTSPQSVIDEIRDILNRLNIGPDSEVSKALARLERAGNVFERGEVHLLHCGELIADIPPGIWQWLVKSNAQGREESL